MGALIQTKGTQYLANFFNQRFTNPAVGGNLYDLRNLGGLESDFSKPFGVSSLFYLSEKYRGKWVDGSDVLYPTCSVTGVTSVVGHPDELTFPAGAFPMGTPAFITNAINAGSPTLLVYSESRPTSINPGIVVQAPAVSANTIQLSAAVNSPVVAADWLVFINSNHPNLLKRWKYFLQNDLQNHNHAAIQAAVHQVLADPDFDHATFQTIEFTSQSVSRAIEFDASASNFKSLGVKFMNVVLQTPRTTSPTPLDQQR